MRQLITILLACIALKAAAQQSPNGMVSVKAKDGNMVVCYRQQPVLEIKTAIDAEQLRESMPVTVKADYQMLAGKRLHCVNEANEYRTGALVLRIYNDGIAFRYQGAAPSQQTEQTAYRIPEGTRRWIQQWTEAYEGFFPLSTTYKVKPEPSFSGVFKSEEGWNNRWGYPALIEPRDGVFTLITEANIERGQSASCLYNDGEWFRVVQAPLESSHSPLSSPDEDATAASAQTPWRVVIIGTLADVVESTLVTDVSEPCKLEDTSWIRPGVVSWVYWAYNHGSNDYNIIKKYVDMAATLHLPYVLIDAEWDEMKDGKTVEDAVSYAKSQGVKPLIWYNSSVGWVNGAPGPKYRLNKSEDREKEFAWCEKIGVAGVKIDFFSGDNQLNMDYCQDLLECAARHHLLVNFHGATIPRGWQRTYPNLLSTEGVYGAEWYNNVPTFTNRAARHNATLPFTRNVIGPMDYTPCAFSDSQHPHITTNAHELALTVLYESGLQHLADKPESYYAQPQDVQDFFSQLPVVWDETRLVSGYPGESVVMARRHGNTWYVAGINGTDEKCTLPCVPNFLAGRQGTLYADGTPWNITTTTLPDSIECQPRGGFVAVINPLAFGKGRLSVRKIAKNAVRIQYTESQQTDRLPDWVYVKDQEVADAEVDVQIDQQKGIVTVTDATGRIVFTATKHQLQQDEASLTFTSPKDESLFGLGQFQDGYSNVRGLSRRLTQVNTQISIPMVISSKGYGVLWNNYGLTEFNPCEQHIKLTKRQGTGAREEVDVTSTEGGKREVRERHVFEAILDIDKTGDYALLLDVGQKMARRHNLVIDGKTVIEMQNLWLPPTASTIVHLKKGSHRLTAELTKDDQPVLYYNKVKDETTFRSPVAQGVDYTVFVGSADEIIATYRDLTGAAPEMPQWALGYIHCRERFHSSDEILETANRFRKEELPVDVLVQDWQYWGKHGWNSMQFDEDYYPDPKALTDSLHKMNIRLMLSVWSKIDKNSVVGRQMQAGDYYIPGTDWIDFFNPQAAAAYWQHFSERLVPLGIDAWWQDATEPENDDLAGRRVNKDLWAGEQVRNIYPLLVCKTVSEGLRAYEAKAYEANRANKPHQPFILTRSGFPGIQRYGVALWSGDVGNDWEAFRRQLTAGLGLQAAGIPWWTYDAGGFFRPHDQYTNQDYIERMLRWIETSVYLPLMRVHGYMSNTEPWNYGPEAQAIIADCLRERYRLLPYIERCAKTVSEQGGTLMRPFIFDFADDAEALKQKYEYMFGPELLISPVTEPGVTTWHTYLPKNKGGWYDYHTGQHYDGGQYVTTPVTKARIPVFRRAQTDLPPFVYHVENTGAGFPKPELPGINDLPVQKELPDALKGVNSFKDWAKRRSEIAAQIQHYGIGEKPAVKAEQVKARMAGDTLIVDVTVNGETLTLRSEIKYPETVPHEKGTVSETSERFALMIGTSGIALPKQLFDNRPIATMVYREKQVNDYGQWGKHHDRGEHNFDRLYPDLKDNGAYSEWAWGLSRLIDGLQLLGPEVTKIDMSHIGVTGCSYAGKMALYCGAFDERIALTIAQEPGGGGAAAWRISHLMDGVENLDRTDYHWFLESQKDNFHGDSVYRLPYDQHELCALVCPRALLLLGNPDYRWLADSAMLVSAKAAIQVWERFGIADRMGWSIVDGHGHCQLPESQWPEVQAFIDKFLLGRETEGVEPPRKVFATKNM